MWANGDKSAQENEAYGAAASFLAVCKQSLREWSAHSSIHTTCYPINILSNRENPQPNCWCSRREVSALGLVPAAVEVNWCGWMGCREGRLREENNRRDSVRLIRCAAVQRTHVSGVNRVQRCQSGVSITCCVIKLDEREMKSFFCSVLRLTEPQVRPNTTFALRVSEYSELCIDAAIEIRNYYSFIWITVSTCTCVISILSD